MPKPLFIPLYTEYYDAFLRGDKKHELRMYGPRWNEKSCAVGRPALLSKGYGKQNRATSTVKSFSAKMGYELSEQDQKAVLACHGLLNIRIAVIGLADPVEISHA
ncbi:MAG TPA: hypothetical protein DCS48_07805 [Desulfovibrio sp.]|nr:hypothetical protein [Desulfovibrio sp.]